MKAAGDDVSLEGVAGRRRRGRGARRPSTSRRAARSPSASRSATTNGGIRLEVPAGSRFDLEAEARRGDVDVDVPGLSVTRSGNAARSAARVGGGGSLVKLSADGDVDRRGATASDRGRDERSDSFSFLPRGRRFL